MDSEQKQQLDMVWGQFRKYKKMEVKVNFTSQSLKFSVKCV